MPSASENGDAREDRRLQEHSHAVADVLNEVVEPASPPRVTTIFFDALDAPERQRGLAAGLGLADPAFHEVGDVTLEVIAQLAMEIAFEPVTVQQS